MSKKRPDTRQRIAAKALEMFNEKGIEYVGMRELAALLDIRVSNITYYFPTKDDLVNHLSLELNKLNSEVLKTQEKLSMESFLMRFYRIFQNHMQYRCLLLSFVHLITQNKKWAQRYQKTESDRNATLRSNLRELADVGYLELKDRQELDFLVSTIALIARFWISEARVSYQHLSSREQINHYIWLISKSLGPYLTSIGKKQSNRFLASLDQIEL